jgi:hypothetical protein
VLPRHAAAWQLEADPRGDVADKLPSPRRSPDGQWVVTVSREHLASIRKADARGTAVVTLAGHTDQIRRVAWSADGGRLVSASRDHTARVWGADGALLAVLEHDGEVHDAWFGDDGNVVTAYGKGTAEEWTLKEWTIDPRSVQRALWLSTPYCLDADARRRLLEASKHAEAAHDACEHMSRCLRDAHGTAVESRYGDCLATFYQEQAQAER